jgi:transposase
MMGERQVAQEALLYQFSIERHVPADHMLRAIDRFVDLGDLRRELSPFYSDTGRPSIDPERMLRMLIVGYCFGIRSERRLCDEVHLNLAYRWFCRLGLEGDVPDHSTFSKNRHGRFRDSDLLRRLFETVLQSCIDEGLVGGEGFAVDASLIKADANKQRSADASETVDWDGLAQSRRSVREYLDTLDDVAWVRPAKSSRSSSRARTRRVWMPPVLQGDSLTGLRKRALQSVVCQAFDRGLPPRGRYAVRGSGSTSVQRALLLEPRDWFSPS